VSAERLAMDASDLSRRYGRRWVVRRVSARFEPGTVSLFVGPNGAGKTTLFRLLAGTLRATEGTVTISDVAGERPLDIEEIRRSVALLGHEPGCYAELSGPENLKLFAGLYGRPDDDETLDKILTRVGLGGVGIRPTSAYSRGMLQRLGLARLIVQDARIWLMDEPTTGLDEAGRALLRDVLQEARERGRTLIAITHDVSSFGDGVDRVYSLERGRLVGGES
jgi:heme ABC exporter ATP-binding subunit CcmA